MQDFRDIPIKSLPLPITDNVALDQTDDRFVDVAEYSCGEIKVNMQYAKANIPSATKTAYVREGVAKRLMAAKKLLPDGYTFEIFDAWRPFDVQLSLFNGYKKQVLAEMQTASEAEINKKVSEFVSLPDKTKTVSYVHSSGGAVDITLLDQNGNPLDMGTEFDDFSEKSYTAWYEQNDCDNIVKKNRRLLYNVLSSQGFTNFPAEWWHYDFGDAFWAFYTKRDAIYSSKYEETDVKSNDRANPA